MTNTVFFALQIAALFIVALTIGEALTLAV